MIDEVVAAIAAGRPVLLPTDTVYGLCVNPEREEYARRLYGLKGRDATQPTALLGRDLDALLECVPELDERSAAIAGALFPGPFTLVVPNPARRFPWLTGSRPETIGVRVPALTGPAREVLARAGVVAATSANLAGGPDPHRLEDVPAAIREGCAAEIDGGELPGIASTVIDVTGAQPVVLREGAVPAEEALARVEGVLRA